MAKTLKMAAAGCASALIVLLTASCAAQTPQETAKPATQTSEAPAVETAPAAVPAEGAAAPSTEAQPAQQAAPAQDQNAQPKQ